MKIPKYIIFVLLLLCLHVGVITYATYCSYNQYGNYHCTYDDGSYEYWNDQSNGNPYSGLPHYYSNGGNSSYSYTTYVKELTPSEKCNQKYPGTIYRASDGRCACLGDAQGTSSWDNVLKKCLTNSELNAKCDKQYPGTIYRHSDGWCACPTDYEKGTSSWSKDKNCISKIYGEYDNETKSKIATKETSSWNFLWQVIKVEIGVVVVACLLGGYGIFIIWFLLGIPMIISGILVGLGIIDENNIAIIGLINVIWFWGSLVYGPKFMESLPSKNDKKVT